MSVYGIACVCVCVCVCLCVIFYVCDSRVYVCIPLVRAHVYSCHLQSTKTHRLRARNPLPILISDLCAQEGQQFISSLSPFILLAFHQ
jgi:hypothetical protein